MGTKMKKLKDLLNEAFEGVGGVASIGKNIKEVDESAGEFDYDYFIGQIEAAQEAVTAVEEELIRTLDMLADDDEIYGMVSTAAQQSANQARRYINGAEKQLEGLQKMLERAKRQSSFDA